MAKMAKKRKSEKAKKRTGKTEKSKSARRAVNIKVNVLSKNPKKRKVTRVRKNRTPVAKRRPIPRDGLKRKYSGRRFVICAHTRGGKRFYETADRKFTSDRKKARVFPTFVGASKEAHEILGRMPESVKSLNVEFAK